MQFEEQRMNKIKIRPAAAFLLPLPMTLLLALPAQARVTTSSLFSDNMILQANSSARIYGSAAPHETVIVNFAGHKRSASADVHGHWSVDLGKLRTGEKGNLKIQGNNLLVIKNVLAGEVWLCAGQSNMAFPVQKCSGAASIIAHGENSEIRVFVVAPDMSNKQQDNIVGAWKICNRKSLPEFSAVAYLFGKELHQSLNCPVGIIQAAYGGSGIKTWISIDVLSKDKSLSKAVSVQPNSPAQYMQFAIEEEDKSRIASPERSHSLAAKFDQPLVPGTLFNAMIAPLTGFTIKGIAWYQGEADAEDSASYKKLFPLLIGDWRQRFKEGKIPFLFVQLPNFETAKGCTPTKNAWAQLRDAQSQSLRLENTAMVVAIDLGEAHDLHPKIKDVVAHRLALLAQEKAYGRAHFSGPIFANAKVQDGSIICSFQSATGLHPKYGELEGFEICGADRKYQPAAAKVVNDQVVVQSPKVVSPIAVRYAWANNPRCNLYNGLNLPTAPFCSERHARDVNENCK